MKLANQSPKKSVVVVGGGPGGSLSALLLARQGFDVTLLEYRSEFKHKVCGEYLCPAGVELLSELGLARELELERYPKLYGMEIYTPDGKILSGDFDKSKSRAGISVRRQKFDQNLLALAKQDGVKVWQGFKVTKVENLAESWRVLGIFETKENTIESNYLVAADGRNSLVARELDLTLDLEEKKVALHTELPNPFPRRKSCGEMHLLREAYIGLNPVSDTLVNLSLVCSAEEIFNHKGATNTFKHFFLQSQELTKRWPKIFERPEHLKINAVTPVSHYTKNHQYATLALVGDAAGFIDPLTGEGIFQAIKSASLLAQSFAKNPKSAGTEYQRLRQKSFGSKNLINHLFQLIIRSPFLISFLYFVLSKTKNGGNFLIAVIGNTSNSR